MFCIQAMTVIFSLVGRLNVAFNSAYCNHRTVQNMVGLKYNLIIFKALTLQEPKITRFRENRTLSVHDGIHVLYQMKVNLMEIESSAPWRASPVGRYQPGLFDPGDKVYFRLRAFCHEVVWCFPLSYIKKASGVYTTCLKESFSVSRIVLRTDHTMPWVLYPDHTIGSCQPCIIIWNITRP